MYERVLKSADYQQLLKAEEPCPCGSKSKLKECHSLDLDGVLSRSKHPDGDSCPFCPYCITLPALTQLGKIANHLTRSYGVWVGLLVCLLLSPNPCKLLGVTISKRRRGRNRLRGGFVSPSNRGITLQVRATHHPVGKARSRRPNARRHLIGRA